ncbi:hypothetical protein [Fibrella forsythiae]|uniref:Lipocalin-like domain-containing protein n=1 Tax=Fibrella forsythiae TaxID=2817061 RepID=A0ABS3JQE6_9BACT|nr:hypothetical protein [Fibrella forsythiae]MBO0952212.1 hypothetical protein [Fibrella forsythiae]
MKTIGLLLFLSFLISCKGGEPEPVILGDWLLRESFYQGCFGGGRSTFGPEDQHILHFSPPNRYRETIKGTLIESGTFTLALDKDKYTGKDALALTLTPEQSTRNPGTLYPFSQRIDELNNLRLSLSDLSYSTTSSGATYSRIR